MKTNAAFVSLKAQKKIHAHSRQTIMPISPGINGRNRWVERNIPKIRLTARKRKGKSMSHIIDVGHP
jgi:hypothetical protein